MMIQAHGVTVRHPPGRPILEDVRFEIDAGQVYALLGMRGAGKTAVVNLLRGDLRPVAGAALVDGLDAGRFARTVRQRIAFVSGPGALYGRLSPRQNAGLFARLAGAAPTRREIANALRRMGVPERVLDAPARTLEPGHRLAVSLAAGVLRGVKGFVLDEPTFGLDTASLTNFQDVVADLGRDGAAILVATSDISFASSVADRVGIMRDGRLATECTPQALLTLRLPDFLLQYAGGQVAPPDGAPA